MSNMLYILGARLAQATGKLELSCRGLLRFAVMDTLDQLNTTNFAQIQAHINAMTYDDWKAVIEGDAMASRLISIGIQNPATVVVNVKQALVETQSLLTISAR